MTPEQYETLTAELNAAQAAALALAPRLVAGESVTAEELDSTKQRLRIAGQAFYEATLAGLS